MKSVAFPRRRLLHGFTKCFRRNAALAGDPWNVLSCRISRGVDYCLANLLLPDQTVEQVKEAGFAVVADVVEVPQA